MNRLGNLLLASISLATQPAFACNAETAVGKIHAAIDRVEDAYHKNHLLVHGACHSTLKEIGADQEVLSCTTNSAKRSERVLVILNLKVLNGTCKQRILESNERAKGREIPYNPDSSGDIESYLESETTTEAAPAT